MKKPRTARTEAAQRIKDCYLNSSSHLNLENLQVGSLPSCIHYLKDLKNCNVSNTGLTSIPSGILPSLTQLTELNIARNHFRNLNSLEELPAACEVDIRENPIETVHTFGLNHLRNLKIALGTDRGWTGWITMAPKTSVSFKEYLQFLQCVSHWQNRPDERHLPHKEAAAKYILGCYVHQYMTLNLSYWQLESLPPVFFPWVIHLKTQINLSPETLSRQFPSLESLNDQPWAPPLPVAFRGTSRTLIGDTHLDAASRARQEISDPFEEGSPQWMEAQFLTDQEALENRRQLQQVLALARFHASRLRSEREMT